MWGWNWTTKKQTSESINNKSESLRSFWSCRHHSRAEFPEEIWEWSGFAEIKGRFLICGWEEEGRKQKDAFHRVDLQAKSTWAARGLGEVGNLPNPAGEEDGDRECEDKMMMCQWGNRRGAKDGKGNMVRPVCTGKYGELSAQQSQRKCFCTKLRLGRGRCVCLLKHLCYMTGYTSHKVCQNSARLTLGSFLPFYSYF